MPPRHQTLPQASTASAREALQSFYCQLCQKGYSRHNEYEAHLSSYDHSHKVRLKEMRAMTRDPNAVARARKAEEKAGGVISIQLGGAGGAPAPVTSGSGGGAGGNGGGFKKGGFKKSGFKSAFTPVGSGVDAGEAKAGGNAGVKRGEEGEEEEVQENEKKVKSLGLPRVGDDALESDTDDEGYEMYDPRHPTD